MAYAYQTLIEQKKLDVNKLPEEVQTAIAEISKTEKGLNVLKKKTEKKGEKFNLSTSVSKKIKMLDSFAVRGIQDFILDKEFEEELELTSDEILKQAEEENENQQAMEDEKKKKEEEDRKKKEQEDAQKKKEEEEAAAKKVTQTAATSGVSATSQENTPPAPDQNALDIEAELEQMHKDGKTIITFQELKPLAPKAYKLIFEGYEAEGKNGINTSHYSLLETEKEKFTLNKI